MAMTDETQLMCCLNGKPSPEMASQLFFKPSLLHYQSLVLRHQKRDLKVTLVQEEEK